MQRWSENFPNLSKPLPICDGTHDIAILFYQFANYKDTNKAHYIKEAIYAYALLMEVSNISEFGTMRFFVDRRIQPCAAPLFAAVELQEAVTYVDVGNKQNMAGYIGLFDHPSLSDYRYVFQLDSDMWFLQTDTRKAVDFKFFFEYLDRLNSQTLYGRESTSFQKDADHAKQFYYRYPDLQGVAQEAMIKIFGFIPQTGAPREVPPVRRHIHGLMTGIRSGSQAAAHLKAFHSEYGHIFQDDEALYSLFLSAHPEIEIADMFNVFVRFGVKEFHEQPKNQHPDLFLLHSGSPDFVKTDDYASARETLEALVKDIVC